MLLSSPNDPIIELRELRLVLSSPYLIFCSLRNLSIKDSFYHSLLPVVCLPIITFFS